MLTLGLILLIGGSIAIILIMMAEQADKITAICTLFSTLLIIAGAGCMHDFNRPQAIDVYRGKTTLQITYKNNVPIDTTVVYK